MKRCFTSSLAISFWASVLCTCFMGAALAQAPSPYPVVQGKVYKFQKIANGVYYATAAGLGSNNVVVINDNDVLIVDTGSTAEAAHAFVADIALLTDKPIRYVVNTHYHYDHTDGNSIFGPEVEIMATDYVRRTIEDPDMFRRNLALAQNRSIQPQIDSLKKQIAAQNDPGQRTELEKKLADMEAVGKNIAATKPTPPNLTYTDKLILHRGGREIDLLFLGRGHTAGDTVVFLPKEHIVCTGDLMESRIAYLGDGYFDEWVKTLDALKSLDFTVDLPGHGVPFTDKGLITAFQSYLTDLLGQVAKLRAQGVSADEAAKRVDMTSHARDFPDIQGLGADVTGVRRAYAWMDEHGMK